jgi:pimeloyl-ACP methyl ester carboxylesterase
MPFAQVNDITMYYEVHGDSGSPLVLIHGYSASKVDWPVSHVQRLATRHRVVIFDNRGVGQTDKPTTPYTMSQFAGDVAGLMDTLGFQAAHIFGISMGGMIAQHVALGYPERVLGLVLGCTAPGEPGGLFPANPSSEVLEVLMKPPSGDRAQDARDAWPIIYTRPYIEANRALLESQLSDSLAYPEAPQYALTLQMEAIGNTHDTLHRLGKIHQPTLIQAGLEDVLVPSGNSRILAERIPNARLIEYPAAGHGYLEEAGFTAVDDILAFLADVDAGKTR